MFADTLQRPLLQKNRAMGKFSANLFCLYICICINELSTQNDDFSNDNADVQRRVLKLGMCAFITWGILLNTESVSVYFRYGLSSCISTRPVRGAAAAHSRSTL